MYPERVTYLLQQYLENLISDEETDELMKLLTDEKTSGMVHQAMEALMDASAGDDAYQEAEWDPLLDLIMEKAEESRPKPRLIAKWGRLAAAAAVLLLAVGVWLLWRRHGAAAESLAAAPGISKPATDRAPGGDKAVLTLADGSSIKLDETKDGVVGIQGQEQLIKGGNAELSYRREGEVSASAGNSDRGMRDAGATDIASMGTASGNRAGNGPEVTLYNTLATPRGGQYKLVLPDGSKVWLNAASSLRYPTRFLGKDRVVELKGEAYFEIASNAAMPFHVKVIRDKDADPMDVQVLGTHFNIMGYDEEPTVRATLLEGGIRVIKGGNGVVVKPGEQASWAEGASLKVSAADIEETVAWKEGMFRFNGAGIEQVMRQLSRWYDMDVVYVNGIPKDRFQGEMYRNVSLMKVLKVLEASGVHFSVEGKKLLVRQ